MKITRTSLLSSKTHTRDIKITAEQLAAWERGTHIQVAAPHLTPADREFVMTGITAEEWATGMEGDGGALREEE